MATSMDPDRVFPDGITRQYISLTITGHTQRVGSATKTPKVELRLDLDPTQTAYDAAHVENLVVKLLNDVQGKLAAERGEDGV